jgi:hypothetical protein
LVVSFLSNERELRPPYWRDGRKLSADERRRLAQDRIKLSLAQARERAERFLTRVYPDFALREFTIQRQELVYREYVAYMFQWEGAFNPDHPTSYPNAIDMTMNPETGVILDYSAEDFCLPEGFRFGFTREDAIREANAAVQDLRSKPWFKEVGEPHASLMYIPAKRRTARDRLCWVVGHRFDSKEPTTWDDMLLPLHIYDAATGGAIDEHTLPEQWSSD